MKLGWESNLLQILSTTEKWNISLFVGEIKPSKLGMLLTICREINNNHIIAGSNSALTNNDTIRYNMANYISLVGQ